MNEANYIKIDLLNLNQKNMQFFTGKIPGDTFLKIYTVEPAEYDMDKQVSFASKFKDDEDYYKYLIKDEKNNIVDKAFQRKEDKRRVKDISKFLNSEEYALFPNTIIVTCDLANDLLNDSVENFEEFITSTAENKELLYYAFLENINESYTLYVPNKKNALLVIDGQHRVRGLEESLEEIRTNYDLVISFIIGYDRATIAKLFYTINYTQKSVNKSQLYHLTGEFSKELSEVSFMHEVVKVLNELEKSPFFKRIKMLGIVPSDINPEEKNMLTISQAFLIDYLVPTINEKSKNSIYQPIFLYYFKNEEFQIEIIRFIIKYFNAIKNLLPQQWINPEVSIIVRTISIGAFLRTMHFLFVQIFLDEFECNPEKIKNITSEDLERNLNGIENLDFSREGNLGMSASAGSLNKLKESIIRESSFSKEMGYEKYIERFKEHYLPEFKQWVSNNV